MCNSYRISNLSLLVLRPQGAPLPRGPCTHTSTWDGYQCRANDTTFLEDATLKPSPLPKYGIFGDPQVAILLFAFEF